MFFLLIFWWSSFKIWCISTDGNESTVLATPTPKNWPIPLKGTKNEIFVAEFSTQFKPALKIIKIMLSKSLKALKACWACALKALKGQCHEIFCFWFFSWISFPQAPEYTIRAVSIFFENSRRYSQLNVDHRCQRHRWQNCHRCQWYRRQICRLCQRHRWQTIGLISGCRYLKVNLNAKMYTCVNSTIQRCPNKIIKNFLIEDFSQLPPVSTLSCEYLREFSKNFETVLMGYSGAGGKLIDEKNQKRKISWHCPFKLMISILKTLSSWPVFAQYDFRWNIKCERQQLQNIFLQFMCCSPRQAFLLYETRSLNSHAWAPGIIYVEKKRVRTEPGKEALLINKTGLWLMNLWMYLFLYNVRVFKCIKIFMIITFFWMYSWDQ